MNAQEYKEHVEEIRHSGIPKQSQEFFIKLLNEHFFESTGLVEMEEGLEGDL